MNKIRVMLVDDQTLLREGLKTIINLQEDMTVIAEANNGKVAVETMNTAEPDVVLMDISMPVMDGVEATDIIKREFPDTAIIILTTFDDDEYIIDALSNGASGYLLKDIDALHLVQCIRDAYNGQLMLPSKVAVKLAGRIIEGKPKTEKKDPLVFDNYSLSDREKEIGTLLAEGLSNSQIAKKLFLTEGTVKNYVSVLYQKIGTNNRTRVSMLIRQMLD